MTAIVIDTETTGMGEFDRVIELAIIGVDDSENGWCRRFNPGIPIPLEATAVHGITDEDVAGESSFRDLADVVRAMIEGAEAVIGYNPTFDQGMIDGEMRRALAPPIKWPPLIDAKRLWDVYEPREKRNLSNAYRRFVDRTGFEGAHGALADSRATFRVITALMREFELVGKPWTELDPERQLWWGPTHHVIKDPASGYLTVNFGKSRGQRVVDVDLGYWRWLAERDFPKHVLMLALHVIKLRETRQATSLLQIEIDAWANEYARENFA